MHLLDFCDDSVRHPDGVTMDGMTLSFHQDQARIVHPWVGRSGELVMGSLFKDRIFVPHADIRKLLLAFARNGETFPPFPKLFSLCTVHE